VTKISQLMSGYKKGYVLEIKIPKVTPISDDERRVKIAKMEVQLTDFNGEIHKKNVSLEVELLSKKEQDTKQSKDKEVMTNYYRVRGAELLGEAKALSDKGQFEDAQRLLKAFKEELSFSSVKDEGFVQNLIADISSY